MLGPFIPTWFSDCHRNRASHFLL